MAQQEASRPETLRSSRTRDGRGRVRETRTHPDADSRRRPERLAITSLAPSVSGGAHPSKRVVGDIVDFSATVVCDGAVEIGARLRLIDPWGEQQTVPMTREVGYHFTAALPVTEIGLHTFVIEAWIDRAATLRSKITRKQAAGQATSNEHEELRLLSDEPFSDRVVSRTEPIIVDRQLAAFGAWYELFPRSTGRTPGEHGTLRTCMDRLDHVANMGFDILYLPPIHPIGRVHRKGAQNAVVAGPADVGSPWAIGAAEGGHTSIHPDLGTFDDFDLLVRGAAERQLEIAMDIAFQCSPDHPWIAEHPEWFAIRPDGSIAYAENPPKQYQDIVPFDFDSEHWQELWTALADVVRFWHARGIRVFRVDNPHTKPFQFWEWLIAEIRSEDPGVIFLAEAFSHPDVMMQLSRIGFSVSYTHFPWQHTPQQLEQYHALLADGDRAEFFRGSAWVNTPDILTEELQQGLAQVFATRLVLAATTSACYGVYGPVYELQVADAVERSEEYRHGEKYEVRTWDLGGAEPMRALIEQLNEIRHEYSALQHDRSLVFHHCDNPRMVAYTKTAPRRLGLLGSEDPILVVVNTDHHNAQDGFVRLDLGVLGGGFHDASGEPVAYEAHDLLSDQRFVWQGADNYVRLDPWVNSAHVFALHRLDFTDQQRELT